MAACAANQIPLSSSGHPSQQPGGLRTGTIQQIIGNPHAQPPQVLKQQYPPRR